MRPPRKSKVDRDVRDVVLSEQAPDLIEVKDGVMTIRPHPGQVAALRSTARFTFITAGTQGGKTSFLPWWLNNEIERRGAGDYIAVTSTYDLFKLKFLPEMKKVFLDTLDFGDFASGERTIYNHENDTRIILRSAQSPAGLESATALAAIMDECGQDEFTLEAWEAVKRRVSLHMGRVCGGTTLYNFGWLKREYDKWVKGDKNLNFIQFESIMNPRFPREEFERARADLPQWKFDMMYRGVYSRPAGMIFSDFDEASQVCIPYTFPDTTPIIIGIDPGGVNTATVYIALQQDLNRAYVFEEHLEGGCTTADHADNIKKRAMERFKYVRVVGGAKSEEQFRRDMGREGVRVYAPKVTDVEAGLDRIIQLMKTNRLYISMMCGSTLAQIREYSRKVNAFGEPTEEIADKASFHMIDALRYATSVIRLTGKVVVDDGSKDILKAIPDLGETAYRQRVHGRQVFDPMSDDDDGRRIPTL